MKLKQSAIYILQLLLGAIIGYCIGKNIFNAQKNGESPLDLIIEMILAVTICFIALFIQVIIHEAGHLFFGLKTGYKFVSFRILGFMWIKIDGKISFHRYSLPGTGGQCLLAPPDYNDGNYPYKLYGFGGVLANLISVVVFIVLGIIVAVIEMMCIQTNTVSYFFVLLAAAGFFVAITNGIPMHNKMVTNDGYNTFYMGKNPEAVKAHWLQLKINEKISEGERLKDLPEEWFTTNSENELKNNMVAAMAVFNAQRLLDKHEFSKAYDEMICLLSMESGIVGLHKNLMVNEIIFLELIEGRDFELIKKRLDKNQKKFMKAMEKYPSILRTECIYALLGEKDTDKALNIMKKFEKVANKYPYQSEIAGEKELMEYAQKIKNEK